MDNKYLILSDIHGNLSAYDAVLSDCVNDIYEGVILLGDCIDYGMRSNEIIEKLIIASETIWKEKVIVNIWGNHEKLVVHKDLDRLSTDRGRVMAEYTAKQLSSESVEYIEDSMTVEGIRAFDLDGFSCLAVHGSLEDYYWKSIYPGESGTQYADYDFVFSGHSHYSHSFSSFYPVDNPACRNKKAVTFINPGSVGQPRNHNPYAQYAVLSLPSKRIELRAVEYDISLEQSLYPECIDAFYRDRLTYGV